MKNFVSFVRKSLDGMGRGFEASNRAFPFSSAMVPVLVPVKVEDDFSRYVAARNAAYRKFEAQRNRGR